MVNELSASMNHGQQQNGHDSLCIDVKEIHNQPDHQILLPGIALSNQQGQGQGPRSVIIDAGLVEQMVLFQEPQAEKRSQLHG